MIGRSCQYLCLTLLMKAFLSIIPDFIPSLGFADDWAALLAAIYYVTKAVTPEIKEKAKQRLNKWFGSFAEENLGDLK